MDWRENIKVITFDLDDTLWELGPVMQHAEQQTYHWLEQHAPAITENYSLAALEDLRKGMFIGEPQYKTQISQVRIDSIYRAGKDSGLNSTQAREIADRAFTTFIELRNNVTFYDGVLPALERLASHYTLGVITNGNASIFTTVASSHFSFSINAEDVKSSKPDSGIFNAAYLEACKHNSDLNGRHEILHVGDHEVYDIEGAVRAGFRAIQITQNCPANIPAQNKKPRKSGAFNHLTSVSTLPDFMFDQGLNFYKPE